MNVNTTSLVAVIFDMDGVLVDSNPFHLRKWIALLRAHRIAFDEQELPKIVLGPPNYVTFYRFMGQSLSPEQMRQLSEELEENFRRAIGPHAQPFPGVQRFIEECHRQGIKMAVASAAIAKNVNFLVSAMGLREYFSEMLTGDEVSQPKPNPEVYLKTAQKLRVKPEECLVFEDSFVGIEAAKRAGMKCVAIASTFSADDLRRETQADLIVPGFEAVSLRNVRNLFNGRCSSPDTRRPS
jgi:HAD superfamily hydrolase (TIGR01509 family)